MSTDAVEQSELRARFAVGLAELYGREVPAYTTLVEVARAVNEDVARRRGEDAERLGSIERVTAERHGAIRVGSAPELAAAARVFAAFGMHPVGFYDLRDASASSVPVVSTAFRPVDAGELARNPFRVFTSMLTADDPRFFDAATRDRLERFVAARRLFPDELLALADRSAAEGGLPPAEADELLRLATEAFRLSAEPVDRDWYDHLERISSVAADIGGVPSTHLNHLTPRVLDIDDLYARMQARGIAMIDEIQGPPAWEGPDVLLRQTSFRALAEDRVFRHPDGSVRRGQLRVRFGEVEQRGIALTPAGRELYDELVAEVDRRRADPGEDRPRADVARDVWRERMPRTERELAERGLAYFTYRPGADGALVAEPIVYEDFLPRSAAGIFRSNLSGDGTRDDARRGTHYDLGVLSDVIGRPVHDPMELYAAQQAASLRAAGEEPATRAAR
jgi:uncharacterized glyoxalase superfamily metalloenzyme YdcJ